MDGQKTELNHTDSKTQQVSPLSFGSRLILCVTQTIALGLLLDYTTTAAYTSHTQRINNQNMQHPIVKPNQVAGASGKYSWGTVAAVLSWSASAWTTQHCTS